MYRPRPPHSGLRCCGCSSLEVLPTEAKPAGLLGCLAFEQPALPSERRQVKTHGH